MADTQEFGVKNKKTTSDLGISPAEHEQMQGYQDAVDEVSESSIQQSRAFQAAEQSHFQKAQERLEQVNSDIDKSVEGSKEWAESCSILGQLSLPYSKQNRKKIDDYFEQRAVSDNAEEKLERINLAAEIRTDLELYSDEEVDEAVIKEMVDKKMLEKHPESKSKQVDVSGYGAMTSNVDWR